MTPAELRARAACEANDALFRENSIPRLEEDLAKAKAEFLLFDQLPADAWGTAICSMRDHAEADLASVAVALARAKRSAKDHRGAEAGFLKLAELVEAEA